ncbi:hypothetical protein LINPERHAP2_LOCUS15620, partial [Linum perenne]
MIYDHVSMNNYVYNIKMFTLSICMRFIDYVYITFECVVLFMFLIISFVLYDLILFIYVYSMSNLTKLDFVALDVTGNNYLSWVLDAEIHLQANALGETIKDDNEASDQDKAKALIFIRHHLSERLKNEYLTIKDPLILWNNLKERY